MTADHAKQIAEIEKTIAHLERQVAKAEKDGRPTSPITERIQVNQEHIERIRGKG